MNHLVETLATPAMAIAVKPSKAIEVPRDRNATFTPQTLAKGQTRITGMDDQVLNLLSTRDISAVLKICMALKYHRSGI